jgi:hypothetical protein
VRERGDEVEMLRGRGGNREGMRRRWEEEWREEEEEEVGFIY